MLLWKMSLLWNYWDTRSKIWDLSSTSLIHQCSSLFWLMGLENQHCITALWSSKHTFPLHELGSIFQVERGKQSMSKGETLGCKTQKWIHSKDFLFVLSQVMMAWAGWRPPRCPWWGLNGLCGGLNGLTQRAMGYHAFQITQRDD